MFRIRAHTKSVISKLRTFGNNLRPTKTRVGYRAPYAVFVHENTQMKLRGEPRPSNIGGFWDAKNQPGNSKYLERPARELASQGIVAKLFGRSLQINKTDGVSIATKKAAQEILDESLKQVPYEYGTLYKSAFIEDTKRSSTP